MLTRFTFFYLFRYTIYCVFLASLISCSTQYPATSHSPVIQQPSYQSTYQQPVTHQPSYEPVVIERHPITTHSESGDIDQPQRSIAEPHDIDPVITTPTNPQLASIPIEEDPVKSKINIAEYNAMLFQASERGDTALILQMIEQGADIFSSNTNGETALHSAAAHNQVDAVRLLIKNGADVNSTTISGWTPLHSAARFGAEDVIHLLIQSGSTTQLRNQDGKSALDLAMQAGHQSAVEVLQGR